jgi:hypothetical protein
MPTLTPLASLQQKRRQLPNNLVTVGRIAWASTKANFKQRPDPALILAALAQL